MLLVSNCLKQWLWGRALFDGLQDRCSVSVRAGGWMHMPAYWKRQHVNNDHELQCGYAMRAQKCALKGVRTQSATHHVLIDVQLRAPACLGVWAIVIYAVAPVACSREV